MIMIDEGKSVEVLDAKLLTVLGILQCMSQGCTVGLNVPLGMPCREAFWRLWFRAAIRGERRKATSCRTL